MKLLICLLALVCVSATLTPPATAQQGGTVWPLDWNDGDSGPQLPMFWREGYELKVVTKYYVGTQQFWEWLSKDKLTDAFDFWLFGYTASAVPDNQLDAMIIEEDHNETGGMWFGEGKFRVWWWEPISN